MSPPSSESILKTLGFAAGVAFVCALIVSTAVYWLRPIQLAASSIDYTRAVLDAARLGNVDGAVSDLEAIDRFLEFEVRIVDFDKHGFTKEVDPVGFDYRLQAAMEQGAKPRYMPMYLLRDGGRISTLVLPFYGPGMWSTIHGLVALETDLSTVAGGAIYDHGETPGSGGRIQAPGWVADWRGKRIYDQNGQYRFRIMSNPGEELAPFAVDGITGATVTVSAVDQAMLTWFGSDGYGPILADLREENR